MRLKHLFYLLLALPLAFASCEIMGEIVAPPVLTLTSDDTLSFDSYGGKGTITYTLENAIDNVKINVSCDDEWVEQITVTNKDIKFYVATNYGAARDTKIVVSYQELNFEVAILQEKAINGSDDNTEESEPSLELTSKATMQFKSTGGKGTITYVLKNPVDDVQLKATCTASWVSNIKVNDSITFNVAANDGDERKARVVVSYGDYGSFAVVVNQNAYGTDEEEDEEGDENEGAYDDYLFNIEFTSALRAPSAQVEIPENQYYIRFEEDSETYTLDFILEGDNDVLKAGTYTPDNGGLIGAAFFKYEEKYTFTDGKVVVKGSYENGYKFDIELVDTNEERHHYTFNGNVKGMKSLAPTGDTRFVADKLQGEYYGAGNYYMILTDNGLGSDYSILPNSTYYVIDLYSYDVDPSNGYVTVPSGTYYFDQYDTYDEGTFSNENSFYIVSDSVSAVSYLYEDGVLEVTSSGITLTVTINGYEHTVTYNGKPMVEDRSESDGPTYDEEVEVETKAVYANVNYYGDYHKEGKADLFYVSLSNNSDFTLAGTISYRFAMMTPMGSSQPLPAGTYYIDTDSSREPWTIDVEYGGFYQVDSYGQEQLIDYPYSGYVTVDNYGNIEAYVTMYNSGETHHIIYTGGNIDYYDSSARPVSTLTDDYQCNFSDHYGRAVYYGDFGNGAYYWVVNISPDSGIGDYVELHFFSTAPNLSNIDGRYSVSDSYESSTIASGYYRDKRIATTFFNSLDGQYINDIASLVNGYAEITCDSDRYAIIEFTMYDAIDNEISGSWSGYLEYEDGTTSSLAMKANTTLIDNKPLQLQKHNVKVNTPAKRHAQHAAKRTPMKKLDYSNYAR